MFFCFIKKIAVLEILREKKGNLGKLKIIKREMFFQHITKYKVENTTRTL